MHVKIERANNSEMFFRLFVLFVCFPPEISIPQSRLSSPEALLLLKKLERVRSSQLLRNVANVTSRVVSTLTLYALSASTVISGRIPCGPRETPEPVTHSIVTGDGQTRYNNNNNVHLSRAHQRTECSHDIY